LMILAGFYKFITINRHSLTIMNHYNIYIFLFPWWTIIVDHDWYHHHSPLEV
jgi:hypothetical protein